ncbi:MAG: EamA/RhaT family transporter [Roseobacter sp.]|mgnify:FL=1|jgi:drug/metabolite transporter (DMT)-like permease|uniref:Permease of the drug/metabolite transporter (DMT) superfamily n=2 Tax=Sulfitobacter TaxID=60136 RepID=A0A1H2T391_9RHOB|nr:MULTISPECIES: DMT family transporter [Sulfitobacter]MAJ79552.1 EamA/RhaT family transporter [Roseobacter sp.]NKX46708.1 DMT family transporter [Rhodobacteraceae bacterium R_SAG8]HBM39008.1 EamA/RhaT family transporter [Sulfitobacter sp.]KAJ31410.1 membrane protein [Sulfitobacter pontiacus 3SOLIMAR09]MBG63698.1 EamA/RhaT family transporter [Roseobacter sp.]|tara:strand:+ start:297 stop:1166 length:870 start_codon:yes stop_codon:yes gene_type:complete
MDNLRGALIMVLSMLGFAIEDMFIKLIGTDIPIGQIIFMLGTGGALCYGAMVVMKGEPLMDRAMLTRPILLRALGEIVGTLGFVSAIVLTPISSASAILQATPLVVTLGAALFLGDPVGWRRWSAILVGMLGVLLVIRPGMDSFQALSLLAVLGVLGLSLRDLATRRVPKSTSTFQLSFLAFLALVPASLLFMLGTGTAFAPMSGVQWLFMGAALTTGMVAYYGIVAAMRIGEISFVTPFRYARLLFAMVVGITIFGERPDLLTYVGATIIVASGIYTVWRERKVKEQA